jgi:hypothetical protein
LFHVQLFSWRCGLKIEATGYSRFKTEAFHSAWPLRSPRKITHNITHLNFNERRTSKEHCKVSSERSQRRISNNSAHVIENQFEKKQKFYHCKAIQAKVKSIRLKNPTKHNNKHDRNHVNDETGLLHRTQRTAQHFDGSQPAADSEKHYKNRRSHVPKCVPAVSANAPAG